MMTADYKAATECASRLRELTGEPTANLAACYLEVLELAKAAYDSRILGHTDEEEALHAAIGEK